MKMHRHLRLVGTSGLLAQLRLDTLRLIAKDHYPEATFAQRERWVQAKLYIAGRRPAVKIGEQRPVDTTRPLRRAPAGLELPLEVPQFLKRFLKA